MKIAIIGAGNVGASIASLLISKQMCDEIALIDINQNLANAKAIDLSQMSIALGLDIMVVGGDDYKLLSDFDIVIITAGVARKDGQSRVELAKINANIVAQASSQITEFAPNSTIIVVTNPLDIMVYVAFKASGFNRKKIIGMAGELDSARLKFALKNHLGTSVTDSKSCVIGMHNDDMICLVDENLSIDEYENIRSQTINGGAKIVKLMNTSAFYAPAAGVINICQALINEDSKVLSCSVLDDNLIAFSRLVKISKDGVKEILELNLKPKDREILDKSIEEFIIYIKNFNINGANINFS
ncbi:malate dehydrogenase [Campylobacter lanienae]|uniref:Malate dehydrogenase n=1 Tax=Campylobacter lanienae TaxID=75658 RepID=A0ABY3GAS1_9BACT|nr:malate dehydrogenase [Campylobacter lanienae]TWO30115.1 malate dehydrogenase [Campylobacter lanienae]